MGRLRKENAVSVMVESRRRLKGVTTDIAALATVGSRSTWQNRLNNPIDYREYEIQKIFDYFGFNQEEQDAFHAAMRKEWKK